MYGNNGMHVTAGTVGQLSYLIVGVNPFQKKNLHNMPNYRGKKKIKMQCIEIGHNLKTLQLETDKFYSVTSNRLKLLWRTL